MSDKGIKSPEPGNTDLVREKLEREVEELRQAPVRARHAQRLTIASTFLVALLSATTTGIVAYSTYLTNHNAQEATALSHREDAYAKLIENLGSPNPEIRVGATVGLRIQAWKMDGERRAEITAILMTLLTEEADSRVLQAMIPTIVEIGGPSINDIAQSNRYAVRQYIADSRTAVLTQMPSLSHYKTGIVSLHQDQRSPNGAGWHFTRDARDRFEKQALPLLVPQLDFSLLTDGERDAMEATEPEDNALKSSMSERVRDILFELTAGRKGDLGQNSSTWNELQDVIDRKEGREQATQSIKRLPDEIRRVYLTGMVLSRLMARHSGAWDNINLDGVSLLSADLRGLKARGLNMPNAFIVGDARGSDLAEANFSGANLLDTNLSGADLSYATLDHALLPSQDALGWPSGAKAKQRSNMNGANWWSALNGSLSDKREIVGISLAAEHPDQTMGFTYRCPQLDPTPDERKEFGLLMTFCDFPTYDPSFTRAHPVEAGAALRVKHFGKRPRPATFSDRYN